MYPFHQLFTLLIMGTMVFGIFGITNAGPIPRDNTLVSSNSKNVESLGKVNKVIPNHLAKNYLPRCLKDMSGSGDVFELQKNNSNKMNCVSNSYREMTRIYRSGCIHWESSVNRMGSEYCAEDENAIENWSAIIVYTSGGDLGRVDFLSPPFGLQNSNKSPILPEQKNGSSENSPDSSLSINDALIPQPIRFDRMSQELFDGKGNNGTRLVLDSDFQLVISGKLAHMVPKVGQFARAFEFGDLVFLFFFALLPEEKRIRRLFFGVRHFHKMFRGAHL